MVPQPINLALNDVEKGVNSSTMRGGRIALKALVTDDLSITATAMNQNLTVTGQPHTRLCLNAGDPNFGYGPSTGRREEFTRVPLLTHDIIPAPTSEKYSLYDVTINITPDPSHCCRRPLTMTALQPGSST